MKLLLLLLTIGLSKNDFGYNFVLLPFGADGAVFKTSVISDSISPSVSFYNPSFLSNSTYSSFVSSYLVSTGYGGVTYRPTENLQFGALFFTTGSIDKIDSEGVKIGTYSSNYIGIFARYIPDQTLNFMEQKIHIGFGGKLLYQNIDDKNSLAVVMDAGGHFSPMKRVTFAFALTNLGYEIKPFEETRYYPPVTITAGMSFKAFDKLNLLVSTGFEADYGLIADLGVDFTPVKIFSLRAGYSLKGKDLNTGGTWDVINGFSLGVKFKVRKIKFAYSVVPMGELGITHFVGVSF